MSLNIKKMKNKYYSEKGEVKIFALMQCFKFLKVKNSSNQTAPKQFNFKQINDIISTNSYISWLSC